MADQYLIDPELLKYATPLQKKYVEAVNRLGGYRAAERELDTGNDVVRRCIVTLQRYAARQGYAPNHFTSGVAPGYRMGKVTIQRSAAGVERVWERQHPTNTRIEDEITALVANIAADIKGMSPAIAPPTKTDGDFLATYWFGDPHFGLASSAQDGGENTNIEDANRLTRSAIDNLVSRTAKTDEAILCFIGDNLHANDSSALTPKHKHPLDVDPAGFGAAFLSCSRAIVYAILRALKRHQYIDVWILPGNHDADASFAVAVAVSMYFDNNPRIKVKLSREYIWGRRFGKNLIAACHGDRAKAEEMHGILSNDFRDIWHLCEFRYIFQGHIHHDTVKEYQRTRIESIRTLAKSDSFHRGNGYRSMRDTRAIVYHKDYGEFERHTINASALT
jgi:hypothetical protein